MSGGASAGMGIGDTSAGCSLLATGVSHRCANGGCGPCLCILWRQTSRSQASWPSFSRRPRTNLEIILPWSVLDAEGVGFLAIRDGIDSMCAAPFRSRGMAGPMPSGQRTGNRRGPRAGRCACLSGREMALCEQRYFMASSGTSDAHTSNRASHSQRQRPMPCHAARQGPGSFS